MRLARFSSPVSPASALGVNFWFRSVPPVEQWSIFAQDLITAVGPFVSANFSGDMPSDTGFFASLPFAVAPMTSPKVDGYKHRPWKEFNFTSGYQKDQRRIFEIYCNNGIKVIFEPNREMIEAMKSQMPNKVTVED